MHGAIFNERTSALRARERMGYRMSAMLVALLATTAVRAHASEEPAPLAARLGLSAGRVTASFDVTSAFTESFRRKLSGGLTSRVLIEVELVDGSGDDVLKTVRACQLRLDVWEDVLFVGVTDEERTRRKNFLLVDDALRACGVVEALPLAPLDALEPGSRYRLVVRVALNPVSLEVLDRTREFMANPRGTGSGRPRAFFSAVARLFSGESDSGGERFAFRSSLLSLPVRVQEVRP